MRGCSGSTNLRERREWLKNISRLRAVFGMLLFVSTGPAALLATSCQSPGYRCEGQDRRMLVPSTRTMLG